MRDLRESFYPLASYAAPDIQKRILDLLESVAFKYEVTDAPASQQTPIPEIDQVTPVDSGGTGLVFAPLGHFLIGNNNGPFYTPVGIYWDMVSSRLGIGTFGPTATLSVKGTVNVRTLNVYANDAAALAAGLVTGDLYRDGGDPDHVCVVK